MPPTPLNETLVTCLYLINFQGVTEVVMHLSMFSPTPQYEEGGNSTKQEIKYPYLGTTDKIKSPFTNAWK